MPHPAIARLIALVTDGLTFGEVHIRGDGDSYDLRHHQDAGCDSSLLRSIRIEDLRSLAHRTATGAFRPLKSAPNLPSGWICIACGPAELESALRHLYPGAAADWFAAETGSADPTDFRAFTGRQSGIYRAINRLPDTAAAGVVRACCASGFCVKRRLWAGPGLLPDPAGAKSIIPCFEPCAILLEQARKTAQLLDEARLPVQLGAGEWGSVIAALRAAADRPDGAVREGDTSDPLNPRRVAILALRLQEAVEASAPDPDSGAGGHGAASPPL